MSLATACKHAFILCCISVNLFAAVHRRYFEEPNFLIEADISVANEDPLKLKVVLTRLINRFGDTDEEPNEFDRQKWKVRWLKHAMAQPIYIAITPEGFEVLGDDLDARYKSWPELLDFIKGGKLFDLLFAWEFILQGKDVQEGLIFQEQGHTFCVESLTDDEIIASVDDKGTLTWDRHNPLLYQLTYDAASIQSFIETP